MLSKTNAVMAAALAAGLGLGAVLGTPGVSLAQEVATTTVVENSTEQSTDATATDETNSVDRTESHRAGRGECEQGQSGEEPSTES